MAEGWMPSVAISCHCYDDKNPFDRFFSKVWPLKPLCVVKQTLDVLEEYKEELWVETSLAANGIKVLLELYQEKLVTDDEVKRMKGDGGDLFNQLISIQCMKSPEVLTRTADVLDNFAHNVSAKKLRVLNELFTRRLITVEECSEMAKNGSWMWKDHLSQLLLTKPAEVVVGATQVLKEHICYVKEELKLLSKLYRERLVTEDEIKRTKVNGGDLPYQLISTQCTNPPDAVSKTAQVLYKFGHNEEARKLRVLSELYQERLVTKDEVKRMKVKGGDPAYQLIPTHCTDPPKVATKTADVLDKFRYREEARKLRVLNELFDRHLLTAKECSQTARKGRWKNCLAQVLSTKPTEVVNETNHVLKDHDYHVNRLKLLLELYQKKSVTEDEVKELNREGGHMPDQLILIQYTKPRDVVARAADVLDKFGHNEEARRLRVLLELHQEKLVTEDEVKGLNGEGVDLPHQLILIQYTKPRKVVTRTTDVLHNFGHNEEARHLIVLSELYQERLVTENEVKKMKGEGGDLFNQFISIQCTKPPDLLARIADVLDNFGHKVSARKLRVLNTLFTRQLLMAEECSEMARKGRWLWTDHLSQLLLTKPAEIVQGATKVLKEHSCHVKALMMLSELYHERLVTEDEVKRINEKGGDLAYQLIPTLCTNAPEVVTKTADVLYKCGYIGETRKLRVLSEMYQERLVTEDEVKRMKIKGGDLAYQLLLTQCTNPPEVVTKTADILDKFKYSEEARKLKALNDLFTRCLITAEDCSEVARNEKWKDHLAQVLSTKPAAVVQDAYHVLKEHDYHVKWLKLLLQLYKKKLVTEDDMERLNRESGDLPYRLILIQYTKPQKVVTRTADVLDKFGHNGEAWKLIGLHRQHCKSLALEHSSGSCTSSTVSNDSGYCGSGISLSTHLERRGPSIAPVTPLRSPSLAQQFQKMRIASYSSDMNTHLGQFIGCLPTIQVPSQSAGRWSDPPKEPATVAVKAAEATLDDLCWIPLGVQSQSVGPEGGKLYLHPSTGAVGGEDRETIILEVPPGACIPSTVQVRSAIIPVGPFTLPEGYQFGSMVVYIYYKGRHFTRPLRLHIPHWYGGKDHVRDGLSFAMAPHTLNDGELVYQFELLEEGIFGGQCGVLHVGGHCTLFALVFKVQATCLYYASLWTYQVDGKVIAKDEIHKKVVITYAAPVWIEVLLKYWKKWKSSQTDPVVQFMFSEDKLQGKLSFHHGEGWQASLAGTGMVHKSAVFYPIDRKSQKGLKSAVMWHIYPPAIHFAVVYSSPIDYSRGARMNELNIEGTNKGQIPFPFKVYEMNTPHTPGIRLYSLNSAGGDSRFAVSQMNTAQEGVTPFSVSEFLKKHETEFFAVVNAKQSLLRLRRKGVITEDVKSSINTSNTKDSLEILYDHLIHHCSVDTLKAYCEVAIEADGFPKMQSFGKKMSEELKGAN